MKKFINNIIVFDNKVLRYFEKKDNNILNIFFSKFTYLAECGAYAIFIFIVMFFINYTRDESYLIIYAVILNAVIVNLTLKKIVKRTRPFIKNKFDISINHPKDFSFPSGHSSVTAATTVILIYYCWIYELGILLMLFNIIFLFLMAYSRLYLRVHYFSDVFFGVLVGLFNGAIVLFFSKEIIMMSKYIVDYIILCITR